MFNILWAILNKKMCSVCRVLYTFLVSFIITLLLSTLFSLNASAVTSRALLVGINKYVPENTSEKINSQNNIRETASPLKKIGRGSWFNLDGTHNDVDSIKELIISKFGFEDKNIIVLKDDEATRDRILSEFNTHLIKSASSGDISFFFYAGHGSQRKNTKGLEPDLMDETIVPADSYKDVDDIRDKELAALYNKAIDKGINLTVINDSCHSGSIARGLDRDKIRQLEPILDDIAIAPEPGLNPEDRGALIISAAQDYQEAKEQKDQYDKPRGVFSLALIKTLEGIDVNDPANLVFLKIKTLMQTEGRLQEPVIAGTPERRNMPIFGTELADISENLKVGVLRIDDDRILLQGGQALGLTKFSELSKISTSNNKDFVRIQIAEVKGLNLSEAKVIEGDIKSIKVGDIFQLDSWSSSEYTNLTLNIPPAVKSQEVLVGFMNEISKIRQSESVIWISDPTQEVPSHIMSWNGTQWIISDNDLRTKHLGKDLSSQDVLDTISVNRFQDKPKLFILLPPTIEMINKLQTDTRYSEVPVEYTTSNENSDYTLAGRLGNNVIEYSWISTEFTNRTSAPNKLKTPLKTEWIPLQNGLDQSSLDIQILKDSAIQLAVNNLWFHIKSPDSKCKYPYKLALKNTETSELKYNMGPKYVTTVEGETYNLILIADGEGLKQWKEQKACKQTRFIYVFAIDSESNRILLFPLGGTNVEHSFPYEYYTKAEYQKEIQLGNIAHEIKEPLGLDTYFLITTEDAIPNPLVLSNQVGEDKTKRETIPPTELLSSNVVTKGLSPVNWSIERLTLRSIPASRRK